MQEPKLWGPRRHSTILKLSPRWYNYLLWWLGRKLRPSGEAMLDLNCGAISPTPVYLYFYLPFLVTKVCLEEPAAACTNPGDA